MNPLGTRASMLAICRSGRKSYFSVPGELTALLYKTHVFHILVILAYPNKL
jgi:hypothetical protein